MFLQRPWIVALIVALVGTACSQPSPGGGACTGTTAKLRREDALTVGVDLEFPPYAFRGGEAGAATGFEVGLARLVATELGLELVIENRASAALVTGAIGQRHDLAASALRDTPELADQACLSVPYLDADLAIVAPTEIGPRSPEGASDIPGLVVGVVEGTTADAWTRRHLGRTPSVPRFETADDLIDALERGTIDAAVDDEPLMLYTLRGRDDLRLVDTIDLDSHFVFLTARDNGGLMAAVDTALEAMAADGRLADLQREWFGQEL